jgi:hypothetical protein
VAEQKWIQVEHRRRRSDRRQKTTSHQTFFHDFSFLRNNAAVVA